MRLSWVFFWLAVSMVPFAVAVQCPELIFPGGIFCALGTWRKRAEGGDCE